MNKANCIYYIDLNIDRLFFAGHNCNKSLYHAIAEYIYLTHYLFFVLANLEWERIKEVYLKLSLQFLISLIYTLLGPNSVGWLKRWHFRSEMVLGSSSALP